MVPPFDFVKGEMPSWAKRDISSVQNTIYKMYSRKSTNLTVVALSCKTTGQNAVFGIRLITKGKYSAVILTT